MITILETCGVCLALLLAPGVILLLAMYAEADDGDDE